jgi:hypothetical protein
VFVTIGEAERPQISSMHTNRPLFNLPSEGVSLYQSSVVAKFMIPDIAMVSHDTTRMADPSVSASLPNPARAASTYSYSPDRSRARYPVSLFPICGQGCREVDFHLQPWNSLPGPTKAEGDQRFESISLQRGVSNEPCRYREHR